MYLQTTLLCAQSTTTTRSLSHSKKQTKKPPSLIWRSALKSKPLPLTQPLPHRQVSHSIHFHTLSTYTSEKWDICLCIPVLHYLQGQVSVTTLL